MKNILLVILTIFSFFLVLSNTVYAQDKYTIFVTAGCPHCAKVEAFIKKYGLEDKVDFKQTYNNEVNQKGLVEAGKKYNIPDNQLGVPFMVVDDTTYYMGDQPIIDFFANKYNLDISDMTEYNTSISDIIFLAIGGLVLFGILVYGVYSIFNKKNN